MQLRIRQAREDDIEALLALYTHLHNNPMPCVDARLYSLWSRIMSYENHHIIVGVIDGIIVSSCVVVIVPNLTHGQRPYALVENVVTDARYRKKGFGTAMLRHAKQIAAEQNCYKIMLMTGSKEDGTLSFYRKAGYNSDDKTAFVQWL